MGRGPGSYTGLRVGLATAAGLAAGHQIEILAFASMEAMAFGFLRETERITLVVDARRSGFYVARYERAEETERPLCLVEPTILTAAELGPLLAEGSAYWTDAPEALAAALAPRSLPRALAPLEEPLAQFHLELARRVPEASRDGDLQDLTPLYLRRSSAEERKSKEAQ